MELALERHRASQATQLEGVEVRLAQLERRQLEAEAGAVCRFPLSGRQLWISGYFLYDPLKEWGCQRPKVALGVGRLHPASSYPLVSRSLGRAKLRLDHHVYMPCGL